MRSVLTLCLGVALGGIVFWAVGHFGDREDIDVPVLGGTAPASPAGGSGAAPPAAESGAPGPSGDADEGPLKKPAVAQRLPGLSAGPFFHQGDPGELRGQHLEGGIGDPAVSLASIVDTSGLQKERELTHAQFDIGETDLGKKLMERFYNAWKDNGNMDLTPEVSRLLKVEDQFARRREYFRYLAQRGGSTGLFQEQVGRAVKALSSAEADRASALAAWEELTLGYELARNRAERQMVLAHLRPFLERMVFSGRSALLLTPYAVQSGDNLSSIAERFDTTVGSIRRLNGLSSDVIQPRQRLKLLSGTTRVFVVKGDFRLWVTIDDRFLMEMPVGLGRDNATPVGSFVIKVKEQNPTWWRPGQPPIPPGDSRNILGSRWLGFGDTEEYSGFGIHGTSDPGSIGRESSAGCVRLAAEDVELLYDFVPYRTEVIITS